MTATEIELRKVAVLCVAPKSVYHSIEGVDAWDPARDAWKFPGGMPVVAHPPCRAWSAYCAHQAKPKLGEKELGLFCVDQVKKWGGVLEQPAFSRLWDAANLPQPGGYVGTADWWTIEVWQHWWGYPNAKRTWLLFSKINPRDVHFPLRLHSVGGERRRWQLMGRVGRSKTPREFAEWLVKQARLTKPA